MRRLALIGVSLALLATPTIASTGPVAAEPVVSTAAVAQSFTGGGIGKLIFQGTRGITGASGSFVASGQLGRGRYTFELKSHGHAVFTRADGVALAGTVEVEPGACGDIGDATCRILELGGTGDVAHVHMELAGHNDGAALTSAFLMRGTLTLNHRVGYVMVDANGTTYAFGGIDHRGDANTAFAVDVELTPTGAGYWVANAYGQVYAFGDAPALGNADLSTFFTNEFVTSITATPTGHGYWLFTSRGRAIPFGDAQFFGDLHSTALHGGIVGSIATPSGQGYYMVASDGGVFAFGDAKFHGSMGATRLNQPVVGIVPTSDNSGYWLVASDGGVFSFNAPFRGSMGAVHLNQPIRTLVRYGNGYLMVGADGGTFSFSNAPFFGSLGGITLPAPVLNAAAAG